MSMYSLAISPISGFLQLVPRIQFTENITHQDGVCKVNHIHIASSDKKSEYILPQNPKSGNWIKIFSESESGWLLHIPYSQKVILQNGMRILNEAHKIYSNMNKFDFIHLVYIGKAWHIENKSYTLGIS